MTELKSKLLGLTKLRYEAMPLLMTNMQELVGVKDPILPLLKCHLLTEILLDRLIELAIEPNGKAVTEASLSYSKKLEIASKMMLIDDFELIPEVIVNSLRKLNRLRNRMAHTFGATISAEEVKDLFMGIEHPMPITPSEDNIALTLYHYTSFIFGNMLPKYEEIESD